MVEARHRIQFFRGIKDAELLKNSDGPESSPGLGGGAAWMNRY